MSINPHAGWQVLVVVVAVANLVSVVLTSRTDRRLVGGRIDALVRRAYIEGYKDGQGSASLPTAESLYRRLGDWWRAASRR